MTNAAPTPSATKANARSVYVHPDFARRGIAREIMTAIEAEITAAGFAAASLTATLSGIPLYRRLGYRGGEPVSLALGNSLTFVGLGMSKILAQGVRKAA
jgi:GNAT superfamily N-acetyltransferase